VNELELISLLTRSLPGNASVIVGAGDDCAVLDLGLAGEFVLFKTDAVVEGVHFESGAAPEQVGHKALARCLSDVAAMAGRPTHALVTLGLPPAFDPVRIEAVYRGLNQLAVRHDVAVVGGETTANPGGMLISISLLGRVARERCLLRSGSQPGDALFVTGDLGGALERKHLTFEPRLSEAAWLADHVSVHAMIDLSDGLAGDLRHLLKPSALGALLQAESIPVSRAARQRSRTGLSSKSPLLAALTDGEDFELLFTVAAGDAVALLDAWKDSFPKLKLTCIGKITGQPGIALRDKEGLKPFPHHAYLHFA
jgi:thiamine-monophosphate kinase